MKEERKRILQLVDEGKLTVNEALTLLEKLEKDTKRKPDSEMETELSKVVADTDSEHEYASYKTQDKYKSQSTTDKIFEFVESAFQKVKDLDLDFNFGKHEKISHIFQQSDTMVNEVDIDIANGSLTLIPWDQKDVRVECDAKVYRVDSQDEARKKFLQQVEFTIVDNKLHFILQQKLMKVAAVCYVPKTDFEKIQLRLFNGPITAEQLVAKDFKAKTANGKITLEAISGKSFELETANGHISVTGSSIEQMEAETINGKVSLQGSMEHIDVQTFYGNLTCLLTDHRCNYFEAKVVTGGVDIRIPEDLALEGELKTNLGGFKVDLPRVEILEEKQELAHKLLRLRSIDIDNDGKRSHFFVETKTGSISLKRN